MDGNIPVKRWKIYKLITHGALLLLMLLLGGTACAGTVTYIYTDAQGTPIAEADADGNIIAQFDYTPYGVPVPSMSPAPDGPGYTGHVNDPDTGLIYMQARYYDPAVGRFLSVDPVSPKPGNAFNFNRYDYANNNPYGNIDPDGRQACGQDTTCQLEKGAWGGSSAKTYGARGGDDEASQIINEVRRDFIGRQAEGAKKVADGASAVADVIDEEVTDAVKYWWLGGVLGKAAKSVGAGILVFKTTREAASAAEAMGFKRINKTIHGQAVFQRGRQFITRDVDGHNGGTWKMAGSVDALGSKQTRAGTFNADLSERIGD